MRESSSESFSTGANTVEEVVAPADAPFDPESEKSKPFPTPENPSIDEGAAAGYAETILELSKKFGITNERKLFDAFVNEFEMQNNLPQARAAFGLGIKLIKAEGRLDVLAAAKPNKKVVSLQEPDYQLSNVAPSKTPFGETQVGQEFDAFLTERENIENERDPVSASLIQKLFGKIKASLFPAKKTEAKVKIEKPTPKAQPKTPEKKKEAKYIPGMSVSVFRDGKMINGLAIADMDKNGKFFFKDPKTGEKFERDFADIEMWNNQLTSESVEKANSMEELLDIVAKSGGVMGSNQYYKAEYLIDVLKNVRDDRGRLSDITKSAGLREKVYQLMTRDYSAKYDDTDFGNRID